MRRFVIASGSILLLLIGVTVVLAQTYPGSQSLRITFGIPFLLVAPGLAWSFVLVSERVEWIERIGISFALSIAIVPLMILLVNQLGIPITSRTVFVEIFLLIMAAVVMRFVRRVYLKTTKR